MLFWYFSIPSLLLICSVMGYLFWTAREVPDAEHVQRQFRLNPELVRGLAYALVIIICLIAALYEVSLYDDLEP